MASQETNQTYVVTFLLDGVYYKSTVFPDAEGAVKALADACRRLQGESHLLDSTTGLCLVTAEVGPGIRIWGVGKDIKPLVDAVYAHRMAVVKE
jgi:hypothetical protein